MASKKKLDWLKDIRGSGLKPAEITVVTIIYTYTDGDLENAHPGLARLVDDTGMSAKTVKRALSTLKEKGWLVVTDQGGNQYGKGRANVYALRTPKGVVGDPLQREARVQTTQGGHLGHQGGQNDTGKGVVGDPPSGPYIRSYEHSEGEPSGSSSLSQPLPRYDMSPDADELEEQISDYLGGFDCYEESTVMGMLANGVHPKAIENTILKQRDEAAQMRAWRAANGDTTKTVSANPFADSPWGQSARPW